MARQPTSMRQKSNQITRIPRVDFTDHVQAQGLSQL